MIDHRPSDPPEVAMCRTTTAILLAAALLITPTLAKEKKEGPPSALTAIEWVGKHRDYVIKMLGQPVQSKKTAKGEVLTFHGPMEWFADPSDLRGRSGQGVIGPESDHPVRIGVSQTPGAASPADEVELVTDSEGNVLGGYGGPVPTMGTGGISIHKLKIFLDDKGIVYKTKVGKRITH
jgi:hypothetical protein